MELGFGWAASSLACANHWAAVSKGFSGSGSGSRAPCGSSGSAAHKKSRRARERHELASLDSRTIRDLGLSASDVQFEVNKPFWRS